MGPVLTEYIRWVAHSRDMVKEYHLACNGSPGVVVGEAVVDAVLGCSVGSESLSKAFSLNPTLTL